MKVKRMLSWTRVGCSARAEEDDPTRPLYASWNVTSMHAIDRYAKAMEWRRYSGQMREPWAMRFVGILKTRDEDESSVCQAMHASDAFEVEKPMSCAPQKRKR